MVIYFYSNTESGWLTQKLPLHSSRLLLISNTGAYRSWESVWLAVKRSWVRSPPSPPKNKGLLRKSFVFIQSEGLVCNCRQAYVISEAVCHHLGVYLFGLITYLSAKWWHTSLRDDYIPSYDGLHPISCRNFKSIFKTFKIGLQSLKTCVTIPPTEQMFCKETQRWG